MKTTERVADRDLYTVYKLNGVTYVPHYQNASVYVGPGYNKNTLAYSADYLIRSGAVPESAMLWKRGTSSRVLNVLA